MAFTYKKGPQYEKYNNQMTCIIRSDGVCIPTDENNMDYQEYLEWAKTNTIAENS